MSVLGRIWSRLSGVKNAVDASTVPGKPSPTPFGVGQQNGVRTNVTYLSLPSLQEMSPRDRAESVKTSRFLDNRLGLVSALNENSVRFAIGEGIFGYSATGDPKFDSDADRFIDSIVENREFDITHEQNFYDLQQVAIRAMIVDGDCGAAKILPRDGAGNIAGAPQIQLFTTDQIGNNGAEPFNSRWQEGILRTSYGRAQAYRVLKQAKPGEFRKQAWDYKAEDFMLVVNRKRIGLGRGMPWSHQGHDNGLAIMDLDALEKAAAYVNSYFAAWIETPTGETPEALEQQIIQRIHSQETDSVSGSTVTNTSETVQRRFLELFGGGAIPVFKTGEKLQTFKGDRAGPVETGYMKWLAQMLAIGYCMPPSLVWLIASGTGPESRVALNQANWYFKSIMRIAIERLCKPVRDWLLLYGLLLGRINGGKPPANGADYRLARWRGPKDMTIDERYFFKTWIDRLDNGLGTEEEFYAFLGQDADPQAEKRIIEIAKRMEMCKKYNVPYEAFRRSMPGQASAQDLLNAQDGQGNV